MKDPLPAISAATLWGIGCGSYGWGRHIVRRAGPVSRCCAARQRRRARHDRHIEAIEAEVRQVVGRKAHPSNGEADTPIGQVADRHYLERKTGLEPATLTLACGRITAQHANARFTAISLAAAPAVQTSPRCGAACWKISGSLPCRLRRRAHCVESHDVHGGDEAPHSEEGCARSHATLGLARHGLQPDVAGRPRARKCRSAAGSSKGGCDGRRRTASLAAV